MRRAEWRHGANVRGVRAILPSARDALSIRIVRETIGGLLALALGMGVFPLMMIGSEAFFGGIVALGLLMVVVSFIHRPLVRRFGGIGNDRGLFVPTSPKDGTYLVHVAVRYKGALTGLDDALAAFVDGWLYLEGQRTTFSLHAADGKTLWRDGVLRAAFEDGQSVEVRFADDPPGASRYFAHAAAIWAAERDDPGGEPVRPPLATHPTVRAGWKAILTLATLGSFPLMLLTPRSPLRRWPSSSTSRSSFMRAP